MKKWMNVCLMLLVSASLTLAACGNGEDDGEDTGTQDTATQDTGTGDIAEDTGQPDTTEGDTTGQDTTADAGDARDTAGCAEGEEPADEDLFAFSGSLQFHALTRALDQDATLADAEYSIAAALTLIGGGEPTLLKDDECQEVFASWGSEFTEMTADWSFNAVDISDLTPGMGAAVGLAGHLSEQPDDPTFLRTVTGLAAMPIEEDVADSEAFLITMETEAALVDLMADESDDISEPGDLASEGFVVLQFLDADGNPVSGVTVTTGGHNPGDDCSADSGDRFDDVYYPNADYTAIDPGPCATTSETGIAIMPGVSLNGFTGVHVEDGTEFTSQQAASTANTAFVGFRTPAE